MVVEEPHVRYSLTSRSAAPPTFCCWRWWCDMRESQDLLHHQMEKLLCALITENRAIALCLHIDRAAISYKDGLSLSAPRHVLRGVMRSPLPPCPHVRNVPTVDELSAREG